MKLLNFLKRKKEDTLINKYKWREKELIEDIKNHCSMVFILEDEDGLKFYYRVQDLRIVYNDYLIFDLYLANSIQSGHVIDISEAKNFNDIEILMNKEIN